jgi:hypothetical protein
MAQAAGLFLELQKVTQIDHLNIAGAISYDLIDAQSSYFAVAKSRLRLQNSQSDTEL